MTSTENEVYVGELIRQEIRRQGRKNIFLIKKIKEAGLIASDAYFSRKCAGITIKFNQLEIDIINKALGTDFKLN